MNQDARHIIIGTAGHIDHGKTTLIKAMTGTNTDRLKEEQERGISIDLGFSYLETPSGNKLGIVDVPGHERFINNMVAGVVGMDLILLVIAADEGIMPQTREHMDILSLLGVDKAIVVLNKIDLVDDEWLELVELDIKKELKDTFLKDSPIVKVSSFTGKGIDELISKIEEISNKEFENKAIDSIPCLPIDRVFTITGSGTIITGTLISGKINKGDILEIFPISKVCKVRSVQVHNKSVDIAFAGQRVALNLTGIDKQDIFRGCVIAQKDSICPTDIIDVRLDVLKSSKRVVKNGSRLHLFSGTSEVLCRAVLLDAEELNPGESSLAQLMLDEKIAVKRGDRFVVRFYSPLETVGGGKVVEANAKKIKRFDKSEIDKLLKIESGSIEDNLLAYVDSYDQPLLTVDALAKMCSASKDEVLSICDAYKDQGLVSIYDVSSQTIVWSNSCKEKCLDRLLKNLNEFHNKNPYKPGLNRAEIFNNYFKDTNKHVFDVVLKEFEINNYIACNNKYVCDNNFAIVKDKIFQQIENHMLETIKNAKFNFTWFSDIDFKSQKNQEVIDIRDYLESENKLVKVTDNLYTLPSYIEEAKNKIIDVLKKNNKITIAEVRDMFDTTRKTAKPILEYMDKLGITKKTGGESEREAGNLEADG